VLPAKLSYIHPIILAASYKVASIYAGIDLLTFQVDSHLYLMLDPFNMEARSGYQYQVEYIDPLPSISSRCLYQARDPHIGTNGVSYLSI
jgi:hypothetical protein